MVRFGTPDGNEDKTANDFDLQSGPSTSFTHQVHTALKKEAANQCRSTFVRCCTPRGSENPLKRS